MNKLTKNTNPFGSFFEDIFNDQLGTLSFNSFGKFNTPAVNVKESNSEYTIEVAAPGFSKENFSINIEDGVLTISNKTESKREDKNESYSRKEFSYSSFSRSFMVPDNISGDDISAKYENGILNVILPKKEIQLKKSKSIEIK